jgi:hypothetical protein
MHEVVGNTAGTNRKISLVNLLRKISKLLNCNICGSTLNPDTKKLARVFKVFKFSEGVQSVQS